MSCSFQNWLLFHIHCPCSSKQLAVLERTVSDVVDSVNRKINSPSIPVLYTWAIAVENVPNEVTFMTDI
jgi:hypothetical protein